MSSMSPFNSIPKSERKIPSMILGTFTRAEQSMTKCENWKGAREEKVLFAPEWPLTSVRCMNGKSGICICIYMCICICICIGIWVMREEEVVFAAEWPVSGSLEGGITVRHFQVGASWGSWWNYTKIKTQVGEKKIYRYRYPIMPPSSCMLQGGRLKQTIFASD